MSIIQSMIFGGGGRPGGPGGPVVFAETISSLQKLDEAIAKGTEGDWLIKSDITLDENKTIPANVTLHFRDNAKIIGDDFTLALNDIYIVANETRQIFQNINFTGYFKNNIFYADWLITYVNGVTDVQPETQQCIFIAIYNTYSNNLVFGAKTYYLSTMPLMCYKTTDGLPASSTSGNYTFFKIIIEGAVKNYDSDQGTEFKAGFKDKFCIGLQAGRACEFRNIKLTGSGSYNLTTVNITNETYKDLTLRDTAYSPYSGIVIDPFSATIPGDGGYPDMSDYYISSTGSSITLLENIKAEQFVVAYLLSPSGFTQINDTVTLNNCEFKSVDTVVSIGQSQNRNININNMHGLYCHTQYDCVTYGEANANVPNINGSLVAGCCYQIFNCGKNNQGASGVFNGVFCELTWKIGSLGGYQGVALNGCSFKLLDPQLDNCYTNDSIHLKSYGPLVFSGTYIGFYRNLDLPVVILCIDALGDRIKPLFNSCTFDSQPYIVVGTSAETNYGIYNNCKTVYGDNRIHSSIYEELSEYLEITNIDKIVYNQYYHRKERKIVDYNASLSLNGDGTGVITANNGALYIPYIGKKLYKNGYSEYVGVISSVDENTVNLIRGTITIAPGIISTVVTLGDIKNQLVSQYGTSNVLPNGEGLKGTFIQYTGSDVKIKGYKCTITGDPGTWEVVYNDLETTDTLDFGSIAANSQADLTIALTGVTAADYSVQANPIALLESGLTYNAYISADDVVTIRLTNTTASPIDPASVDWNVVAVRL